tara:strand:- start:2 stop:607 length:606 start_codon:yes stop_codon:yes gene_type:complete
MQMIQIFGAWIGATRLSSLDINAALDYVQTIDNDIGGNGATTVTQRLLDVPIFNSVKKEIEILTKEYVVNQGHIVDEVKISSSWGNTLTKGQPISMHQHPNSYVSGVLYLTEGAPLHFHNPLQTEDLFTFRPNVQWDADNIHTWQVMYLTPEPGSMFLFPSKLNHSVEHNETDYRYSIAFNTLPIGELGDSTKQINIKQIV